MHRLPLLAGCLLALPCLAAQEAPYIPASTDIVLQRVPSVSDPRVRAFEALRAELSAHPSQMMRAVKLSEAYVDYGRDTGDARYLGRAEAVLEPWLTTTSAPIPVLLVHATILQSKHYFSEARVLLQGILARDGDNAQAWLTLATVAQVQGDVREARRACAHLLDSSDQLLPGTCLSALNAVDGHAENAYRTLSALWPQARAEPVAVQSWIQGILADTAKYLGRDAAADRHFRIALQLTPGDNFLLADYGDFLLDEARPREALDLVKDYPESDTSFLRQVYAEAALGSPRAAADTAEMARRFAALETRGTRAFRREEAGFVLHMEHDPQRALALAQENWTVQRAPKDMRVFLEAALAAGKPQAAAPVLELLAETHLQYPIVQKLAVRVRLQLAAARSSK
jgi:predicted Zn-dependent protease